MENNEQTMENNEQTMENNEDLAVILEENYGEGKPQDLHINLFYLILGVHVTPLRSKIIETMLQQHNLVLRNISKPWQQFVLFGFERAELTERQKEQTLNSAVQTLDLIQSEGQITLSRKVRDDDIILSRVCKYKTPVETEAAPVSKAPVSKIRGELSRTYFTVSENAHIDHFYLVVSLPEVAVQQIPLFVLEKLQNLPGDWCQVTPPDVWPQTFIGVFFKASALETERAREWRLNEQVRLPLKLLIGAELQRLRITKRGRVIVTRACI